MLKVRLLYCVCVTCSCENRINSITEENHTRYRYTQHSGPTRDRTVGKCGECGAAWRWLCMWKQVAWKRNKKRGAGNSLSLTCRQVESGADNRD